MTGFKPSQPPDGAATGEALSRLFVGPLAHMQAPLILPGGKAGTPGLRLLEPDLLAARLGDFGRQAGLTEMRACASQWSKWHFAAVVVPFVAASLLLQRALPVRLAQTRLVDSADTNPHRLVLSDAGRTIPAGCDVGVRFGVLLEQHLIPLSNALSQVSGASPRVFASNAGNIFEHTVRLLPQHPLGRPGLMRPGIMLMRRRHLNDGRRNPLYRPVRYHATESHQRQRVRRQCCIRYLDPTLDYCSNCPLAKHRGKA